MAKPWLGRIPTQISLNIPPGLQWFSAIPDMGSEVMAILPTLCYSAVPKEGLKISGGGGN